MMISIFSNAKSTVPVGTISVTDFLHGVKFGKWDKEILAVRREPEKKTRQALKENLECVTVSGAFTTRKESAIIGHSQFLCIDVDGYDDKTQLLKDPYTYALFKSASGNGLACLIKIDGSKHKDSFRFIQQHYFNSYGIVVDPAPQNVASLRYVSYDPELEINEKSKVSRALPFPKHQPKSLPVVIGDDVVSQLIGNAVQRGVNLAPDYQTYVNLAFALAAGFGESGRSWFHSLCSMDGKYNSQHADRQYTISLQRNNSGITVGTLYWMLKQAGIEIPSKTKQFVQIAAIAKSAGRTKEAVAAQLVQMHEVKPDQAAALAEEVFSRDDINLKASTNGPKNLIEMFIEWLRQNHPLKRNVITGAYEESNTEITKVELNGIYLRAKLCFDTKDLTYDLCERIIYSPFTPTYNPITEYIDRNKYRKSTGNLDALCRTISSDTPYGEMFLKKWMLAIIAAYHGHPVRYVLALVGGQNTGKCLGKGTKVMMHDTTVKNVEAVLPGDFLMGLNGSKRKVLSICTGKEKMYKIKQVNGSDYVVNESHILSLKNRITKKILNISVKEFISKYGFTNHKYRGYKSEITIDKHIALPIDPYLLGVWLGDGKSDVSCGIMVESMDNEVVGYLRRYCTENNLFLSKYEQKKSKSDCYNLANSLGSGTGKKNKINLKGVFNSLNLSKNKHIPFIYRKASNKQRLQLLAGLIDSDGHFSKNSNYEIIQKSEKLSNDIVFLCRSLGFKTTKKTKVINNVNYYRVTFSGNLSIIPVKISYKKCNKKFIKDASITNILIEPLGDNDYYGFEIDGDKLFLLEDFTVTHNTEWFRRLLPKELQKYYAESKLDRGKDDELLMCQKLIVMDDEMGGKSKQDEKLFKELTSKSVFSLRAPYGRGNEDFKRLAILCGTSNDTRIINDRTGNTRILTIEVDEIDHEGYNAIDKDELFMELYHMYEAGVEWRLDKEDLNNLASVSKDFEDVNTEAELIKQFFLPAEGNAGLVERLTATQIKDYIENNSRQQIKGFKFFGMELKKIFGMPKQDNGLRYYAVIKKHQI